MWKKFRLMALMGIAVFTWVMGHSYPVMGAGKIGVVNLRLAWAESKAGRDARGIIEKEKVRLQGNISKKRVGLNEFAKKSQDLQLEINQKSAIWREEERERKLADLRRFRREGARMNDDLNRIIKESNNDLRERRQKMFDRFLKEIREVAIDIGTEMKFDLIMDRAAGGVLFSEKSLDITKLVIKRYDQKKR
jgi:Skp family chaperone for outer membrane proteins